MAAICTISTSFGERRKCYVRLNNLEASNHGAPAVALFRAFLSKEAFEGGATFVAEYSVEFTPDVAAPLWPQAYAALAAQEGLTAREA